MDRRGFLRGVLHSVTAAGVVVAASPAEIEAFASPLLRDAPLLVDVPAPRHVSAGEHLYNARGEVVAIVTEIAREIERVDVTAFGDTAERFLMLPRPAGFEIRARGLGTVEWDGSNIRLRGQRT